MTSSMRHYRTYCWTMWVCLAATAITSAQDSQGVGSSPTKISDLMWIWGNPEMAQPGPHTFADYAEAAPAERAKLLGAPNIVMAGHGLPKTIEEAEAMIHEVDHAPRLVWEIACDDPDGGPPFEFNQTVDRVAALTKTHPQIEGVLLDDMSTLMINRGFMPEHIRQLRERLNTAAPSVKVWGVVYTMNLDAPNIDAYMRELDVINLWVWHAKDIANLDSHMTRVESTFPTKPIVLGLYLYDYGTGQRMPKNLLELQFEKAREWLRTRRIAGVVLLTINNDADSVSFAANWIQKHGNETLDSEAATTRLSMKALNEWQYSHEGWGESEDGVIHPPDVRNLHSRAFLTTQTFGDFDTEFEFNGSYRETGTGCAGLIIRAQDPNHFYYVYFPWGGQQLRAKHFWTAIAKVDGDGYMRNLAAEWTPGVPSETDRWFRVRVRTQGPEVRVWVDGRDALTVRDETYRSGAIGLAGYGWYSFRNLVIRGEAVAAQSWSQPLAIPSHAFTVGLTSKEMPSACIAPNGDVLLAAGNQLVRSIDKGRSWQAPESLPEKLGTITDYGNAMFSTAGGRLAVMLYTNGENPSGAPPAIAMAESTDNGVTWSEPTPSTVAPEWPTLPKSLTPYGPVIQNNDKALLRMLLGSAKEEGSAFTDVRTWGAVRAKAYVIQSADDGANWSAPIEIDRPKWTDMERGSVPGSLDLTEPSTVVMGNTVMTLVRPIYSPYMWQCWSYDGGATWDAASRATFPGYAQSMVRTQSGAILCAHRYPLYSVNVSRDNGLNWDAGTIIDYPVWGMGAMLEVEPDVVFCVYMNAERNQPLLAQLLRVTESRVAPLFRAE